MIRNRHQDIEIPEENPFEYDQLGRKQHVENFERIVSFYAETGCVMALNGLWGTGKTTFVEMSLKYMRNNGYKPLYFNAWTNDFVSDPLVALLAEMKELLPESPKLDDALRLGGKILTTVGASLLKSVIKNKVGVDVDQVADDVADVIKDQIDEYSEQKQTLADFKDALIEYVADNTENGKPVVFFVDELDRCNPRFAVQMLERIKHLFDIPNMIFVLVVNKEQLQHAICGYYGSENIDAENYLRRFIDVEYLLPDVDKEKYFELLYKEYAYGDILDTFYRAGDQLKQDTAYFQALIGYLMRYTDFDLRTIDKFPAQTRLVMQTYAPREKFHSGVFLMLSYLRIADAELYEQIKEHRLDTIELVERLGESFGVILQRINDANSYPKIDIMSALTRVVYTYAPEQINDNFQDALLQVKIQNIDVDEFMRLMRITKRDCHLGHDEMNSVFEHLGFVRNVNL